MKKIAERTNVLIESNGGGKNFVYAILNAVTKGYSDNVIVDDVIDLVRLNEISKGILATAPEALRSYGDSITNSLKVIADEIENIEIQDAQEQIVRRKRIEEQKLEKENREDEEENVVKEELEDLEEDEEENENEEVEDEEDQAEEKLKELEEQVKDKEERAKRIQESQMEEQQPVKELMHHSKIGSKSELTFSEDWNESGYNEKANKIAGTLLIDFHQDMSKYKRGNRINLGTSVMAHIKNQIFSYFKAEYPKLKAELNDTIFKSNMIFDEIKAGKAKVEYEIEKAL